MKSAKIILVININKQTINNQIIKLNKYKNQIGKNHYNIEEWLLKKYG